MLPAAPTQPGNGGDGADPRRLGAVGRLVPSPGAVVVLVPPERSADLRAYYAKHTKRDRLDSRLLARLPLLHPDGLHPERGLGPGDALRRATKLHSTLVHRRSQGWHASTPCSRSSARLACGVRRRPRHQDRAALPRRRLRRPAHRPAPRPGPAGPVLRPALPRSLGGAAGRRLLAAAAETLALWAGATWTTRTSPRTSPSRPGWRGPDRRGHGARRADRRPARTSTRPDVTSAPGVGAITAAAILGRLGDPNRFPPSPAPAPSPAWSPPRRLRAGRPSRRADQTRRRGAA